MNSEGIRRMLRILDFHWMLDFSFQIQAQVSKLFWVVTTIREMIENYD